MQVCFKEISWFYFLQTIKKNEMILIRQFFFEKDHDTLKKFGARNQKKKWTESTNNKEHNRGEINYTKGSKMKKKQ